MWQTPGENVCSHCCSYIWCKWVNYYVSIMLYFSPLTASRSEWLVFPMTKWQYTRPSNSGTYWGKLVWTFKNIQELQDSGLHGKMATGGSPHMRDFFLLAACAIFQSCSIKIHLPSHPHPYQEWLSQVGVGGEKACKKCLCAGFHLNWQCLSPASIFLQDFTNKKTDLVAYFLLLVYFHTVCIWPS